MNKKYVDLNGLLAVHIFVLAGTKIKCLSIPKKYLLQFLSSTTKLLFVLWDGQNLKMEF